jgi:porphobilinogen synthase
MVEETRLSVKDMLFPLFVMEGKNVSTEIKSMPGIYRYSTDLLLKEIESCVQLGIQSFALFPQISESKKDSIASESYKKGSLYLESIYEVTKRFPEISLLTDVAMDPYSSDGHDGIVQEGQILNDKTLPILAKMAIAQAQAGSKLIGPSDMMDGRIGYLRESLDDAGFSNVGIMAYTAKYASAFYGPFREAVGSGARGLDKKTYQLNYANVREALLEAQYDEAEGADMLMVKPGLCYLDILCRIRATSNKPLVMYHVSGEYAMLKAAVEKDWLDEKPAVLETLTSMRRAGADLIVTYYAQWAAKHLFP